ncbi:MAG: hypothetical protein H0X39_00995 [Actinobacteria bacterium]|nr:hypothetical protein [Actinomycetota bacterium]
MLDQIKRMAARGDVVVSVHAIERMRDRKVKGRDLFSAIASATNAAYQAERDNWKVTGGIDADGDDLTLIVAIKANLIIVTIF